MKKQRVFRIELIFDLVCDMKNVSNVKEEIKKFKETIFTEHGDAIDGAIMKAVSFKIIDDKIKIFEEKKKVKN